MRQVLALILWCLSLTMAAQHTQDFAVRLYRALPDTTAISLITCSPQMLEAYLTEVAAKDSTTSAAEMLKQAHGMRILLSKEAHSMNYIDLTLQLMKAYPERFIHYKDVGNVHLYIRKRKRQIVEIILFQQRPNEPFVLINVTGVFTPQNVAAFFVH